MLDSILFKGKLATTVWQFSLEFDEFFEILTLRQVGRHAKAIGVLNVSGYYDDILNMLTKAVSEKFMTQSTIDLFVVSEDPNTLVSMMEQQVENNNKPAVYKKLD